jgi:hypothetical protein
MSQNNALNIVSGGQWQAIEEKLVVNGAWT